MDTPTPPPGPAEHWERGFYVTLGVFSAALIITLVLVVAALLVGLALRHLGT
jgi:hypothetical protein